jgi:ABC-type phosphate transport system substrate-binding protein
MELVRALAVGWLVGLISPLGAAAGDVAVVVNPANPVDDLSEVELARVFRLDRQHWKAGGRVYLVLRESGAPQKDVVLRRLYRMNDLELKQFWLGKLYRGEIASFPRVVSSDGLVKGIVAQAPNAIGFIDAVSLDETVKALRIEGRLPGESGYLLRATER